MRKTLVIAICILLCFCLCGCGEKPVQAEPVVLSSGQWPADTTALATTVVSGDLALLDAFTQLQSADFSGSVCYDEIIAWAEAHPGVKVIYTVALPDGQVLSPDVQSLDLSAMDSAALDSSFPMLKYFNSVSQIKLPENVSLSQLQAVSEVYPNAALDFSVNVAGIKLSPETASLDLSSMDSAAFAELLPWLSVAKSIESIELGYEGDGSELSWDDIYALRNACPNAGMNYSFNLYGNNYSLADSEMNLRFIPIDDEGALVKKVTACMPNLSYLDMDSCGVSDAAMAEIRDALPDTEVVWRIWFGTGYTARTNTERLLASNPGRGGELTPENTESLKYCTKVKYLDLGHNNFLTDISFVAYMPDLEVAVLAMDGWSDCSPLANCPKLDYLELQSSSLNDLRPLTALKNVKHLNIGYCFALYDISPLFEMPALERLWIGCLTPVPPEQVEQFQALFPDCKVNTTTLDPTEEGWRYVGSTPTGVMLLDPRYQLLRDQLRYDLGVSAYAYVGNEFMDY